MVVNETEIHHGIKVIQVMTSSIILTSDKLLGSIKKLWFVLNQLLVVIYMLTKLFKFNTIKLVYYQLMKILGWINIQSMEQKSLLTSKIQF